MFLSVKEDSIGNKDFRIPVYVCYLDLSNKILNEGIQVEEFIKFLLNVDFSKLDIEDGLLLRNIEALQKGKNDFIIEETANIILNKIAKNKNIKNILKNIIKITIEISGNREMFSIDVKEFLINYLLKNRLLYEILVFSKLVKEEITALPKVRIYEVKEQENKLKAEEIYESDIMALLNTESGKADMILIEITTEKSIDNEDLNKMYEAIELIRSHYTNLSSVNGLIIGREEINTGKPSIYSTTFEKFCQMKFSEIVGELIFS